MGKLALAFATLGFSLSVAQAAPMSDLVQAPVRAVFEKQAEQRQDRVFHAVGSAYHGTVRSPDGTVRPAIIRVSRGGAARAGRRDILGVAVKITEEGGEQDILLVSARGQRGLGARIPSWRGSFGGETVSTLTSFRSQGIKGPITAALPEDFTTPLDLEHGQALPAERPSFPLAIQSTRILSRGPKSVALGEVTVHFDQPVTAAERAELRFSIFNEAGGIEPVGFVNGIRKAAYEGSQRGRGLDVEPAE